MSYGTGPARNVDTTHNHLSCNRSLCVPSAFLRRLRPIVQVGLPNIAPSRRCVSRKFPFSIVRSVYLNQHEHSALSSTVNRKFVAPFVVRREYPARLQRLTAQQLVVEFNLKSNRVPCDDGGLRAHAALVAARVGLRLPSPWLVCSRIAAGASQGFVALRHSVAVLLGRVKGLLVLRPFSLEEAQLPQEKGK